VWGYSARTDSGTDDAVDPPTVSAADVTPVVSTPKKHP